MRYALVISLFLLLVHGKGYLPAFKRVPEIAYKVLMNTRPIAYTCGGGGIFIPCLLLSLGYYYYYYEDMPCQTAEQSSMGVLSEIKLPFRKVLEHR